MCDKIFAHTEIPLQLQLLAALSFTRGQVHPLLYSLILDFRGGTYISQGHGETPIEGLLRCIYILSSIDGLDSDLLTDDLEDEEATEVEGMENIWCFSSVIDDDLILMNLVATIG